MSVPGLKLGKTHPTLAWRRSGMDYRLSHNSLIFQDRRKAEHGCTLRLPAVEVNL